jgi:DNA-binding CsgD family transcriptional regulator
MDEPSLIKRDPDRTLPSATHRRRFQNSRRQERIRFDAFVRSLYMPKSEEELRHKIVRELMNFVPGQNAFVNSFHIKKHAIYPILPTHAFSRGFVVVAKNFIHEHPTFRDIEKRPRFQERLISDFVTPAQWHHTSLYNEGYRKEGFNDQIGVSVCRSGPLCTGVAVLRDKWGFSMKDRQRMSTLAPHFDQALSNVRAFEKLQLSLEQSQAQLNASLHGTIWLDQRFHVLAINQRASAWWLEFFPHDQVTSRLPKVLQEWLERCTKTGNPDVESTPKSFVRYLPGARLLVRWICRPEQKSLLLVLERRSLKPTLEDLRPLGLTRRESEVLLWVAQGKTNGEIARILGGSPRTIDKHVQNLLTKLNLENRAGAILLVADLSHG